MLVPRPALAMARAFGGHLGALGRSPREVDPSVDATIDAVLMRCLEKDRARRYETASSLALDIQRHLAGETVLAAPPSATCRP